MRFVLSVFAFLCAATVAHAQQPNIIVLMTDDQPIGTLGNLPTLNGLANQGVRFTNAIAPYPLCTPNRATLHTGQYAHNHGIMGNSGSENGGYGNFRPTEGDSLGPWMQAAGYRTGMIGKHLNKYHKSNHKHHVPPGWDDWQGMVNKNDYYNYGINNNGTIETYGNNTADYSTDVFAAKAVDFIEDTDPRPFFLMITPYAPHGQIAVADRHSGMAVPDFVKGAAWNDASGKLGYLRNKSNIKTSDMESLWRKQVRSLMAVDEMMADILAALDAKGELDNTYIVFTTDHGMGQGDYKWDLKRILYGQVVRSELILWGPGISPAVRDELVGTQDIAPTFMDIAGGATFGRVMDGRSLLDLLDGDTWRTAIPLETRIEDNSTRYRGLITDEFKYVRKKSSGSPKDLYHLPTDPHELNNLIDDSAYNDDEAELDAALDLLQDCQGAGCFYTGAVQ